MKTKRENSNLKLVVQVLDQDRLLPQEIIVKLLLVVVEVVQHQLEKVWLLGLVLDKDRALLLVIMLQLAVLVLVKVVLQLEGTKHQGVGQVQAKGQLLVVIVMLKVPELDLVQLMLEEVVLQDKVQVQVLAQHLEEMLRQVEVVKEQDPPKQVVDKLPVQEKEQGQALPLVAMLEPVEVEKALGQQVLKEEQELLKGQALVRELAQLLEMVELRHQVKDPAKALEVLVQVGIMALEL